MNEKIARDVNIELSVVIVNYDGKEYVDKCVESIFSSSAVDFEIIVVDNGSTDGSVEYLKNKYVNRSGELKIVELDKNYGPARARNEGMKIALGKYVSFLDNDTQVHPNWSVMAIEEFEKSDKIGIIQCKLLLSKERERLDYVGEYIGGNGFLVQRAQAGEIDSGQYDQKVEILAAKSAGMFMRRAVFEKIGGFDEDYFIYVEETDLGWRSWLAGYKAIFVPDSIVYHEFGTSALVLGRSKNNYNTKFHGTKNYILTIFKNLSLLRIFSILPVHIFLWNGLAWFSLLRGDRDAFIWIYKGIFWNISNFSKNLKKRRLVQLDRKISDSKLFKIVMKRKPFGYYFNKATAKQKIGNAESFNRS